MTWPKVAQDRSASGSASDGRHVNHVPRCRKHQLYGISCGVMVDSLSPKSSSPDFRPTHRSDLCLRYHTTQDGSRLIRRMWNDRLRTHAPANNCCTCAFGRQSTDIRIIHLLRPRPTEAANVKTVHLTWMLQNHGGPVRASRL